MLLAWILTPLGLVAALYGFHRFMLYLEKHDLWSFWRDAPGGSGYNPLLEIYHPQVRHVVQAKEQRISGSEDDAPSPDSLAAGEVESEIAPRAAGDPPR